MSLSVLDLSFELLLGGLDLLILGIKLLGDLLCYSSLLLALGFDLGSLDFGGLSFLMCNLLFVLSLSMSLSLITLLLCLLLQAMIALGLSLGGCSGLGSLSGGVSSGSSVSL